MSGSKPLTPRNHDLARAASLRLGRRSAAAREPQQHFIKEYVLISFLFRKTNRNYGQVLTTVKYRLNVTEQTVHACVHPPYHDPPGVSALLQAVVSVRCGEVHRMMQVSGCQCVCADRLLPSRLSSTSF